MSTSASHFDIDLEEEQIRKIENAIKLKIRLISFFLENAKNSHTVAGYKNNMHKVIQIDALTRWFRNFMMILKRAMSRVKAALALY